MSKLPGTFSIYPRGPKPKSTAPHGQWSIDVKVSPGRGAGSNHQMDAVRVSPGRGQGSFHNATLKGKAELQGLRSKISGEFTLTGKTAKGAHQEDWDPYGNYYFALEINGTEVAHFQECSGLKNASAVFEIEEGGLNGKVHKRPGQSKWENLVLKCATSASQFLVEWRDLYLQDMYAKPTVGPDKRDWWGTTSGAISLKRNDGKVIRRYSFVDAWPVSWEGPALNSTASGLAIETLEIAHGGLTVETVSA